MNPPETLALQAQYLFLAPWCDQQTVLVAQCQQGQGVLTLAQRGAQWIDALDADNGQIQYARQHNAHPSVAYHPKSPVDAQLNRTYQRVLCLNILENADQPDLLIRNLFQHLTDDGIMAVSVRRDGHTDFQTLRHLLVPYFPYLYLYYLNQHVAVSVVDAPDKAPTPVWMTHDRQLDVNTCHSLIILAGKQRFATATLPTLIALDGQQYLNFVKTQVEQANLALTSLQEKQHPLTLQLSAAQQDYVSLKSELLQARTQAIGAQEQLLQQLRVARRWKRFENSPLMRLNHRGKGMLIRLKRKWRHGMPFQVDKPVLPQRLRMPWQAKPTMQPLRQTLSWINTPMETLLNHELDWLKQQSLKKHKVHAGFKKILVIGESLTWATWQEAFELHGLILGIVPQSRLDDTQNSPLTDWLDADLVILHKTGFNEALQTAINTFKNRGTPVAFYTDCLNCDPNILQDDAGFKDLPRMERETRLNRVERLKLTRDVADYCLADSQVLALALKTEWVPAYVLPGPISYAQRVLTDTFKNPERYWGIAKNLWLQLLPDTTAKDTQAIMAVLVKLFIRYPHLTLTIYGGNLYDEKSLIPGSLVDYANRIHVKTDLPLLEQMRQLAMQDIQLLPVNMDSTTRPLGALSQWVRLAALAGTPTVASPAVSLHNTLKDGITGYFASTAEEWLTHLSHLIEQPNVRETQATQAREMALNNAYVDKQLPAMVSTLEQVIAHYTHHKRPDLIPVQPTNSLNVCVALTLSSLTLDTLCRLRTLLDLGHYITLYLNADSTLVDLKASLESVLGPSAGRFHCGRLKDVIHPHDLCLAMDWAVVEALQPMQSRFGLCIRWIDQLDTDDWPMGLDKLRIEQTYRQAAWLHVTPYPWLAEQLKTGYDSDVLCLTPWVNLPSVNLPEVNPTTLSLKASLNGQRLLVLADKPMQVWLFDNLKRLKAQYPDWTLHIMGSHDPKGILFDHVHHAPAQSMDALVAWLSAGDLLLMASTGAPPAMAFWAMGCGLPVVDVALPGRETRYDDDCPVVQLPLNNWSDQLGHILISHHHRLTLAEQGNAYVQENTIPLDSQVNRILSLARQQLQSTILTAV